MESLKDGADWVGLGWVPIPGPMKHGHEGGIRRLAALLKSIVRVWALTVLKKEDVVGSSEEGMLSRQNNDTHSGSLVTRNEKIKSTML